jgi:imidazolonepropionase-like amidohydrolase
MTRFPAYLYASLVAGFLASPMAAEDRPIAITHGQILDGRGGAPITDGTIIIRGRRIESVGSSTSLAVPSDARIIDAQGKTVMPGLADMHVHMAGGWDGDNVDMLSFPRYLNSLLYAGITTVLDTGNVQPYILQLRQEVASGRLRGPRIYCAGSLIEGTDPIWPPISFIVSSTTQIPSLVQRQKDEGVDVLKAYAGLSDPMVRLLSAEGKKVGLRVFIDQGDRNGSEDLIRAGISGFAHLPTKPLTK